MVAGPACLSLSIMFNSQANGLWMAILGDGLMGFFTRTNVLYRKTVQERTKLEFQGRVESTFGILTSIRFLGLYSAMGAAQESVSPRVLIFCFRCVHGLGQRLGVVVAVRSRPQRCTTCRLTGSVTTNRSRVPRARGT
jgi:hypothetical protein